MPDDIVAFLTARLDEDEQVAQMASPDNRYFDLLGGSDEEYAYLTRFSTARVLADVEVKRRIVQELHGSEVHHIDNNYPVSTDTRYVCSSCGDQGVESEEGVAYPCLTLRLLASLYAGHPDYRPQWSP